MIVHLLTLVALVNIHFVDSSIDTYEVSVISVDAGNTYTVCLRVSSLLCRVQLLFNYQGVYTHYYTLLLFVRSFVDSYNTNVL